MKRIIQHLMVLSTLMMLLVGCQTSTQLNKQMDEIMVYFYNEQNNLLEGEKVKIEIEENAKSENKMYAVIQALYDGPRTKGQLNKPVDFYIYEASLKENRAYISFDNAYNQLSVKDQVTYRAAIVWSLTDLEYINDVEFFVEDQPLKTSSGVKVGPMGRKDILINVLNPKPATSTQTITLYFTKEGQDKLYKEQRSIQVNNSIPIEKYVIEELIKGPMSEDLIPILPSDTKLTNIETQEGICQVDLSYDLSTSQLTSPLKESLVIYSIVNSLTEVPRIQKVLFLKNGKKQIEFSTDITTTGIFERNDEFIADTP